MFRLIKKIFIRLLTGLVNGSNHAKCMSLSNQKCIIQPTLINLHLNELEVVILLMTYLIKNVSQIKQMIEIYACPT